MVKKNKISNKHAYIGVFMVVVTIALVYGYFKYSEYYPSTDDAYVNASLVNVAPKVSGYLAEISVKNNQLVHKGDLLFKINPVDYGYTYTQAQKNYDSYVAQVAMAKQQLDVQKGAITKDKAQYQLAQEVFNRYKGLYAANTLSKQAYQNAQTDLDKARIQLEVDEKKYQQDLNLEKYTEAKQDSAKASVDTAKSNLSYTEYYSPADGYITSLNTLTTGEFINASQQMFGIVDTSSWWIDANFKETQLSRIKVGQAVEVKLDMYEHKYVGEVQSVSYASGNTFSLLPAQNATGNWVKVTQRFTVKVKLHDDPKFPLRVGASTKVKVNTTI